MKLKNAYIHFSSNGMAHIHLDKENFEYLRKNEPSAEYNSLSVSKDNNIQFLKMGDKCYVYLDE